MPATMQSASTRGFGTTGGFTGSVNLVATLGFGSATVPVGGSVRATTSGTDRVQGTASGQGRVAATAGTN